MLVVLNNKCHFEKENFKKYLKELNKISTTNELVLCPSNIYLNGIKLKRIFLGSQNVSKDSNGAYTGEVSAKQLKSINVDYCIVGHSESRLNNNEKNEDINSKIKQLLKNNITPILCIGETKNERTNNETEIILKKEINDALKDIEKKEKVIIAYEPLWSIGTNEVLSPDEIEKVVLSIRKIIPNNRILYGGSVTEENIEKLNEVNLLDGYLLGKVSLYPKRVKKLLEKLV